MFRVVSGIGGSIFIAVAFGAVMVWFKDRDVTIALGVSGGAAFSGGAAVALFIWVYLQNATSWHVALWIAGVIELIIAAITELFFDVPAGAVRLRGVRLEKAALLASLRNRDLWIYGVGILGGYGAFFTVSQLFATYAVAIREFPASRASLLAATITLAGIPGSTLGGLIADRTQNLRAVIFAAVVTSAICTALIPGVGVVGLWFVGIGVGFGVTFGFTAWSSVPERVCRLRHDYVGVASGLMLTIAAVGGYFLPRVFGHVVSADGYTAGWITLAIISAACAVVGLLGRNPGRAENIGTDTSGQDELLQAGPGFGVPDGEAADDHL